MNLVNRSDVMTKKVIRLRSLFIRESCAYNSEVITHFRKNLYLPDQNLIMNIAYSYSSEKYFGIYSFEKKFQYIVKIFYDFIKVISFKEIIMWTD